MHKKWKKFVNINCNFCNKEFSKELKEYERQKRNNSNCKFYCSRECIKNGFNKNRTIHKELDCVCAICSKPFKATPTSRGINKTCSRSCGSLLSFRNTTPENRKIRQDKISASLSGRIYSTSPKIHFLVCEICNNNFNSKNKNHKTCSKECLNELMSLKSKANPNCGGETNYKKYKYKEITMDSSWEVELAQWMDENNIKWIRSRKICLFWKDESGGLRRYYPDFYLPDYNLYLDPKNKYLQEKDKYKLESVQKEQNVVIYSGFLDDIKSKINNLMASVHVANL